MTKTKYSRLVCEYLIRKGITQTQLSVELGIPQSTLSLIKQGKYKNLRERTVCKLRPLVLEQFAFRSSVARKRKAQKGMYDVIVGIANWLRAKRLIS